MATDDERYTQLMEHRRWLDSCKQTASRDRDRTTLTLAGGSMAISVGFLERVVPVLAQPWNVLLFIGWVCEVVAMCLILRSMQTSEASFESEIYRTDHMLRTPGHEDPGWPNPSTRRTESFNQRAPVIAVIGLVFMLVHAGIGLTAFSGAKEKTNVEATHPSDSHARSSNDGRPNAASPAAGSPSTEEVIAIFLAGDSQWPTELK
jgi:hypothetical protein